jgi:lactoylglutathione lyase
VAQHPEATGGLTLFRAADPFDRIDRRGAAVVAAVPAAGALQTDRLVVPFKGGSHAAALRLVGLPGGGDPLPEFLFAFGIVHAALRSVRPREAATVCAYPATMPRYLHTSIFVSDMDASIDFYTNKMGLKLLGGPHHYPGNADMAFVGSSWDAYIELVYDLEDHPPYELGNRYEHLALEVDGDLPGVIERLRAQGVKIVKEPKKSPGGTRAIAFVEDPNGIPVELLEPREGPIT